MRFAITAVLVIIAVFGFFIGYAVGSYLIDTVYNTLSPTAPSDNITEMILIKGAFGIICSLSLVIIIFIFVLDTLSDEPETYWRE